MLTDNPRGFHCSGSASIIRVHPIGIIRGCLAVFRDERPSIVSFHVIPSRQTSRHLRLRLRGFGPGARGRGRRRARRGPDAQPGEGRGAASRGAGAGRGGGAFFRCMARAARRWRGFRGQLRQFRGNGVEGYRQSYCAGMQSVLAWAVASGSPAGTIAYTSSTSVYPQGGGVVVDESAPAAGGTPNGAIIREVGAAVAKRPGRRLSPVVYFAPGGYLRPGPASPARPVARGSRDARRFGEHHLNLIHRDDIVAALLACLARAAGRGERGLQRRRPRARAAGGRGPLARRPAGAAGAGFRRHDRRPAWRLPMPDRLISSAKIQGLLGWSPRHLDYRVGFANLLSR